MLKSNILMRGVFANPFRIDILPEHETPSAIRLKVLRITCNITACCIRFLEILLQNIINVYIQLLKF